MNILQINLDQQTNSESFLTTSPFHVAGEWQTALERVRSNGVEVIIFDAPRDGSRPDALVAELHAADPDIPIIVRDSTAALDEAIRLTKAGAFHVVRRDAPDHELTAVISAAASCRRNGDYGRSTNRNPPVEQWRRTLIGESPAMQELVEFIRLVGPRRCTVLISGETGTGKELLARALHMASPRAQMPFIALNCAALPETLLEAELFGHIRGAYTGANTNRTGRFEQANRGTLFLDEIADMPYDIQAKLLRVLQERELQRLGSSETIRVDVRVIAACNVDLLQRVRAGKFREDLYYRLNVVPVTVPPLRDRTEDIPALVSHFLSVIADQEGLSLKCASIDALALLLDHDWPGNVRELENAIEKAVILSGNRQRLEPRDFGIQTATALRRAASSNGPLIPVPAHGLDFERTIGMIELNILEQALQQTNGNKKQAADLLRMKRTTLAAKLKSLETLTNHSVSYVPDRV